MLQACEAVSPTAHTFSTLMGHLPVRQQLPRQVDNHTLLVNLEKQRSCRNMHLRRVVAADAEINNAAARRAGCGRQHESIGVPNLAGAQRVLIWLHQLIPGRQHRHERFAPHLRQMV